MQRRDFILGSAASAAASGASADIFCKLPVNGQRDCDVGLPIGNLPTPLQNCEFWCWAASAAAAFGLAGYDVSQHMFAQKVFGNPDVCATATGPMIKQGVDGPWTDLSGTSFSARLDVVIDQQHGVTHPNPMSVIWTELTEGRPLLSGSVGHATLITAMRYTERTKLPPITRQIILRDPWPLNPNKRAMTPQEFHGASFLAKFAFF